MARTARLYVPLSVGFFDDTAVLEVGERAAWLYLNMLTKSKQLDSDGRLTRQQIERLGVAGWRARLAKLLVGPLVNEIGDGEYFMPAWSKWNELKRDREERWRHDRERKKPKPGTDSGRNPDGNPPDSARKEGRKERREELSLLTHPGSPHERAGARGVGG